MARPSPGDYLTDVAPPSGNTPWARMMAGEIRDLVRRQAAGSARSVQKHLGPSELGAACDRLVVGKMVAEHQEQSGDQWPSVIGTALHAWLAEAFRADDPTRWVVESRVIPMMEHPGTMDLYDRRERAVLDHKTFGPFSMNKIRTQGPSLLYRVQLALYGLGCLRAGLPVDRIGIIAYPRTDSTLDGLYVWEHAMNSSMIQLLTQTKEDTRRRTELAEKVGRGELTLESVSVSPGEDCHFCPFSQCPYRV